MFSVALLQGQPIAAIKLNHTALGIQDKDQADYKPPPGFEKWAGAPYWMHFTVGPGLADIAVARHVIDPHFEPSFVELDGIL